MQRKTKPAHTYNPIRHTIALPPDCADLGSIDWYIPPSPAELAARYKALTERMDAERAARVLAVELLIAADRNQPGTPA